MSLPVMLIMICSVHTSSARLIAWQGFAHLLNLRRAVISGTDTSSGSTRRSRISRHG